MNKKFYNKQIEAKQAMLASTTSYLLHTHHLLEERNKEILEINNDIFKSIDFAKIIQKSLLPTENILKIYFADAKYRIIQKIGIGGDSIFSKSSNEGILFGLLDATGHGIPGAMLSISGVLMLNELTGSMNIDDPSVLIKLLNYRLYHTFNIKHSVAHFEGTLCFFSSNYSTITYCSAKGKILHITNAGNVIELPSTKHSIGENLTSNFDCFKINYKIGDKLFFYSDGLTDQFGGQNDKKFGKSKLKIILTEHYNKNASDLDLIIHEEHSKWKKDTLQTDDLSFMVIQF